MTTHDEAVITTARSYDDSSDDWRALHGADRTAWQPSYDRFIPRILSGGLVLDLGCGPGLDVPAFARGGLRTVGLDISARLLQAARAQAPVAGRLVLGDLRSLPFAADSFDGVWADGSLHHVSKADAKVALAEVCRVLKTGGIFAASVALGDAEGFLELDGINARWYAHYEPDELRAILRKAGLDVVDAMFGEPGPHSAEGFVLVVARKR